MRHARDEQKELGPSEVGDPCERKLAYKMRGVEEHNEGGDKWRARVGTALHGYLEVVFEAYPATRFKTERRVTVGTWWDGERARVLQGSCDLYDGAPLMMEDEETIVDFKTTGPTNMAKYARGKVPEVYRTQIHCYATGYVNEGFKVKNVALLFLPRDDDLDLGTSVLHIEPYDPDVAPATLKRLEDIAKRSRGGNYMDLKTAESFCARCPWFKYGVSKVNQGFCPGEIREAKIDYADPFDLG
jgi:hypothetical protein